MALSPVSATRRAHTINLVLGLLLIALIAAIGIVASWFFRGNQSSSNQPPVTVPAPTARVPLPTSSSVPAPTPAPTTMPLATAPPLDAPTPAAMAGGANAIDLARIPSLIIPVANLKSSQLHDTFTDARSEGRTHDAIDIMAPRNTPVVAAADGRIARFFTSERGGITIYQLANDGNAVFYYAHLERYADGLQEGQQIKQGQVIGYVGDTGNAGAGNTHLHFAIWLVTDPKKYWDGLNVNPYPLLMRAGQK